MRLNFLILVILIFLPLIGKADGDFIDVNRQLSPYSLFVGLAFANYGIGGAQLDGEGIMGGIDTSLSAKWNGEISFTQIFGKSASGSSASPFQVLNTAVQTGISYAVYGENTQKIDTILLDGRQVAKIFQPESFKVSVGAGLDQDWFSGSGSVYPASGLAGFVSGDCQFFGYWVHPQLRYSSLSSGSGISIKATVLSIGFNL